MPEFDLFTQQVTGTPQRRTKSTQENLDPAVLHKLGLAGVDGINPKAKTLHMEPSGPQPARVYVLGDFPGRTEDAEGLHWVGTSGELLRSAFPRREVDNVRWNYVCRTLTPGKRKPFKQELECYRPSVAADIARTAPTVLVTVGDLATRWAIGGTEDIDAVRGRIIPVRINGHPCWCAPVQHPTSIVMMEQQNNRSAQEAANTLGRDLANAVAWSNGEGPEGTFLDLTEDEISARIHTARGADEIVAALRSIKRGATLSVDYETSALRPYGGGKVLTVAVGTAKHVVVFSLDHPEDPLGVEDRQRVLDAFADVLLGASTMLAHNAGFEIEWTLLLYGGDMRMAKHVKWGCTQHAAYILDERTGFQSLDAQCLENLGVRVKDLSPVDPSKILAYPLDQVLRYNALDVVFDVELWFVQRARLKDEGLLGVYHDAVARVPSCVLSQWRGVPLDEARRDEVAEHIAENVRDARAALNATPGVRKFVERHSRPLDDGKKADVGELFAKVLKQKSVVGRDGKYVLDEAVLSKIQRPEAAALLTLRKWQKLESTYVLPMRVGANLWPDGLLHTNYRTTKTGTGRLTSETPNNQNWLKRSKLAKLIRAMIVPEPGHRILAFDYGQIEHRVFAMASRDRRTVQALFDGVDIHMDWSRKLVDLYPEALDERDGDMKRLRGEVKNKLVFPSYFGAGAPSVSRGLNVPLDVGKELLHSFWLEFAGIKRWLKGNERSYQRRGYVECLTGRRRRGPLDYTQICNTPIQGTAAEIIAAAMNMVTDAAVRTGFEWLIPVMQIHDDLTFMVPEDRVDDAMELVLEAMLGVASVFDFVNVPLVVEAEEGVKDWSDMEELGSFSSELLG